MSLLYAFKPLNFSPQFEEIAPRLSLLSQKFEQSENIGQFHDENGFLMLLKAFKAFRHAKKPTQQGIQGIRRDLPTNKTRLTYQ